MGKEIKIRKGNVVLRVSEEEVDRYLQNGYARVGADGKTVQKPLSEDAKAFEAKLQEAQKEIEQLKKDLKSSTATADSSEYESEIEALKEKNSDLQEQLRDVKKQLRIAEKKLSKYEN